MKTAIVIAAIALTSNFGLRISASAADVSTTISQVHLCCQSCVRGVEKAVADIEGVRVSADKDAETVVITGPNKGSVQKAADAVVAAGYFGKSSDTSIKLAPKTGAKGMQVQTLKVEGVHLCCGKCVTTVDKALKSVKGVNEHTAQKNVKSFEVTGDFKDQDVFEALHKTGLSGRAAK